MPPGLFLTQGLLLRAKCVCTSHKGSISLKRIIYAGVSYIRQYILLINTLYSIPTSRPPLMLNTCCSCCSCCSTEYMRYMQSTLYMEAVPRFPLITCNETPAAKAPASSTYRTSSKGSAISDVIDINRKSVALAIYRWSHSWIIYSPNADQLCLGS